MYFLKKLAYYLIGKYHMIKNKHVKIRPNSRVPYSSKFEGYNVICDNTYFRGEIGLCSYIGPDSLVVGRIGRFCSIARNVTFLESTHPTSKFVSSHPAFYSIAKQCGISFVKEQKFDEKPLLEGDIFPIDVGNDVYIGAGVTIIGPVKIGDGAVIAANATVTHNIEPYTIVAGTPAKVIRKRFSDEDVSFLLESKWWNRELEWYVDNGDAFESVDSLRNLMEGKVEK